jgi:hypothetical protein
VPHATPTKTWPRSPQYIHWSRKSQMTLRRHRNEDRMKMAIMPGSPYGSALSAMLGLLTPPVCHKLALDLDMEVVDWLSWGKRTSTSVRQMRMSNRRRAWVLSTGITPSVSCIKSGYDARCITKVSRAASSEMSKLRKIGAIGGRRQKREKSPFRMASLPKVSPDRLGRR